MSTQVQQLRGTTAENNAFTGKAGVITVDTEKNDLRIHDGTTRGGVSLLEKVTDLQRNGGVINGDVTINNASGTNYAYLPDASGYGNPTIRLGYTKENGNYVDLAFCRYSFNIYNNKCGDIARFYDDGTTYFASTLKIKDTTWWHSDGNIGGTCWIGGTLYDHIESRINTCVTDTRFAGYGEFAFNPAEGGKAAFDNPVPSGYVMTGLWKLNAAWEIISYRQPQVYIANRGWFALGGW